MTISEIVRAIRKRWWVVVLLIAIGGGGASLLTSRQVDKYQSSVTFFVSTPSSNDAAALAADQFASRRVNSYVRLLRSDLLARAIHNSGVDLPAYRIASEIHGSADLNTVLLNATVQDSSSARALRIARGIADNFEDVVSQVDAQATPVDVAGKNYAVRLKVSSGPSVSHAAIYPHKDLNLALGLGVGLIIGVFLVWLRELTDTSIRSIEELLAISKTSALGSVPFDRAARKTPLLLDGRRNPVRAEAFRKIRTGLRFAGVDTPIQVLAVSSSIAGEGKTTTAINIAVVTAETGKRVLVVDCDMRRPRVGEYTGLSGAVGLTDVLTGRAQVSELTQSWGEHGLDVLVCGSLPPNPSELLSSRAMSDLITDLRTRYDLIVLDTPPLVPVTDAAVAATLADGLLLVVRQRRTSRVNVQTALRSLDAVDARVAGTVLTMVRGYGADTGYAAYADDDGPRWRTLLRGRRPIRPGVADSAVDPVEQQMITAAADPAKQQVDPGKHSQAAQRSAAGRSTGGSRSKATAGSAGGLGSTGGSSSSRGARSSGTSGSGGGSRTARGSRSGASTRWTGGSRSGDDPNSAAKNRTNKAPGSSARSGRGSS